MKMWSIPSQRQAQQLSLSAIMALARPLLWCLKSSAEVTFQIPWARSYAWQKLPEGTGSYLPTNIECLTAPAWLV